MTPGRFREKRMEKGIVTTSPPRDAAFAYRRGADSDGNRPCRHAIPPPIQALGETIQGQKLDLPHGHPRHIRHERHLLAASQLLGLVQESRLNIGLLEQQRRPVAVLHMQQQWPRQIEHRPGMDSA